LARFGGFVAGFWARAGNKIGSPQFVPPQATNFTVSLPFRVIFSAVKWWNRREPAGMRLVKTDQCAQGRGQAGERIGAAPGARDLSYGIHTL